MKVGEGGQSGGLEVFPDSPLNNKMRCGPFRNARSALFFVVVAQVWSGMSPLASRGINQLKAGEQRL